MNEVDNFSLVPMPPGALQKAKLGANRIVTCMVAETLALASDLVRPPRIVVVDDEEWMLEIIEHFLRSWSTNIDLLLFQNRDDAWQELLRAGADLLITDMNNDNVPGRTQYLGMSGWTMLPLLAERRVEYPILVVSGSFLIEEIEDKARQYAGPELNVAFLAKPFTKEQFNSELLKFLGPRGRDRPSRVTALRVTVVDDEECQCETYCVILRQHWHGVSTKCFQDGLHAWEHLVQHDPDLLIMDLNRAGMGGIETLCRLAALKKTYPILVASGNLPSMEKEARAVAGKLHVAYMSKPWKVEELIRTLTTLLGRDPNSGSLGGSAQTKHQAQDTPTPPVYTAAVLESWYQTGENYYWGEGTAKDLVEAVKWYRKAAEQSHSNAQYALGDCYYKGEGVAQNYAEALTWYRKAAESNHAAAQHNLGVCYASGHGVPQNYNEAVKWYRKAAEQDYILAQNNLGACFESGQGVGRDRAEALKWYLKAAEQGDAKAQFNAGVIYAAGKEVALDHTEAMRCFRKAAEQGHVLAQHRLAQIFAAGLGVEKNHAESLAWNRKAADGGHPVAQFSLGIRYLKGDGVPKDENEAAKWFRKSAEQEFTPAQVWLGDLYRTGTGVPQDFEEAIKWDRKAAEQGNVDAQHRLADAYYYGQHVPKDHAEAIKWFRKAAKLGPAKAQFMLGMCLTTDKDDKDFEEGVYWLRVAAKRGYPGAEQMLQFLRR